MTSMRWLRPLVVVACATFIALVDGADPKDLSAPIPAPSRVDWPVYGGNAAGHRYSSLTHIDSSNVAQLKESWRVEVGEGGLQTSPIVIDGVLYGYAANQDAIALNAATGAEIWRFSSGNKSFQPARGVSFWQDGEDRRLFVSSSNFLYALDPATGTPIATFAEQGRIDLRENLGRPPETQGVWMTSPGMVYRDLIITGFRTGEGKPAAPGKIRAFDVRTGELRWNFNTIPAAGESGSGTWPDSNREDQGGANNWAGMALDLERGIVYVPTGSAVFDFYGGDRHGDNLYANTLLALDAATGRRIWHFQTVRHDLWDRDLASPPSLLTINRDGELIDAVVQASKQGVLYIFDRETGRPLFPIVEQPVLQSRVPGEQTALTQPMPTAPAPFSRQRLTEDMLTRRNPQAHAAVLKQFRQLSNEGPFTPLGLERKTVVFPGFDGGAEWGGAAVDPDRGILYINANDVPWLGGLAEQASAASEGERSYVEHCSVCHGADRVGAPPEFPSLVDLDKRQQRQAVKQTIRQGKGRMPGFPQISEQGMDQLVGFLFGDRASTDTPRMPANIDPVKASEYVSLLGTVKPRYAFTGYEKFRDPDGYPAVEPPWGTLSAIDLNTGEYVWRVPLGNYPELAAQGLADTGTENYGGPLLTAGGLIFIGATIYDRKFRAIDAHSGRLIWETTLPYAGTATPLTYKINGRQFVVIATSGARDPRGPQGSAYIAFALPD